MSDYDTNLYYHPEKLGYSVAAVFDLHEPCWDFDTVIVLSKDGRLYWAADSGCSCPMPFEDVQESDLRPLRSMEDYRALRDWVGDTTYAPAQDGLRKVRKLVRQLP